MHDVCIVNKRDSNQGIVDDLKKLALVKVNFVLEKNVEVRLDVFHGDANVDIVVFVCRMHDI